MDPASAIITFISTGIKVVQLVQKTLDDFRNAPEDLQILQDRVEYAQMLLAEFERRGLNDLFCADADSRRFARLERRAMNCLKEIQSFAAKVRPPVDGGDGPRKMNKFKWLKKRNTLSLLTKQLNTVEHMLSLIAALICL